MDVVHWSVEVFPLVLWPMVIILRIHYIKVLNISVFHIVLKVFLLRSWRNWRSFFPIKFRLLIEKCEISLAIRRSLVNVFKLVLILLSTAILIEELFVLSVVVGVIFRKCHMRSIVPRRHIFHFWRFALSDTQFGQLRVVMIKHGLLRNFMHPTICVRKHVLLMRKLSFVSLFHF